MKFRQAPFYALRKVLLCRWRGDVSVAASQRDLRKSYAVMRKLPRRIR
jgi:hypothetical protein